MNSCNKPAIAAHVPGAPSAMFTNWSTNTWSTCSPCSSHAHQARPHQGFTTSTAKERMQSLWHSW